MYMQRFIQADLQRYIRFKGLQAYGLAHRPKGLRGGNDSEAPRNFWFS